MSQKELNYIEDIYNHQCLIKSILEDTIEYIDDEEYKKLFDDQTGSYISLNDKLVKLLEDVANE